MKKITTLVSLALLFITANVQAQIAITTGQPAADYVNNHLLGLGVTATNITFTGNAAQIGSFNGTGAGFGFMDGTVISSGPVTNLNPSTPTLDLGYSSANNADLIAVAQSVTTNPAASGIDDSEDVGILEFDFVPQSDLVSFNFIFASDEYESWINSGYNDAFGFFVSGPGITGPYSSPAGFPGGSQNLALVPGTNLPITISTIYPPNAASLSPSNPAGLNPQFYVDNSMGTSIQVNGYTVSMNITFDVVCGETYHFRFAVGDMGDPSLATYVFLEAGSFTSPPINLSLANLTGTNDIVEGCSEARFALTRSICQSLTDLTINFAMSGTATNGVDYNIVQTSPLTFLAGEDTMYLDFTTVADLIPEGSETITITINYVDQYGNPQTSSATFLLTDIVPLGINEIDRNLACFGDEIVLTAVGTGGSGVYVYDWLSSNSTTSHDTVSIQQNGVTNYVVSITDVCLGTYTDTVTVTMNQTLAIDTMMTFPASACTPDGAVSGLGQGITGQPHFHWEGPNTNGPNEIDATVLANIGPGWYVFTIYDNVCLVTDSIFLTSAPGPIAEFSLSSISGCNPLDVTFTNNSQNATNFEWYFGNGNTAIVNDMSSQTQTFTVSANQVLIAINGPCRDTAFASVLVVECGCTDPNATNFDPNAVQNDGSCIFPEPSVIVPNIFTPNGDANNDVFRLSTINATEVILKINNRWGTNVYEGTGLDPYWDGKINGTIAPDGVYFMQYTVKGLMGKELTGQGFLQLIRQ